MSIGWGLATLGGFYFLSGLVAHGVAYLRQRAMMNHEKSLIAAQTAARDPMTGGKN